MFNRGSDMIYLVCLCCFLVKEDPSRDYHIQFEDDMDWIMVIAAEVVESWISDIDI